MPSPIPPLNEVKVAPSSLDWALKHMLQFGDTVFVPKSFEYRSIEHSWAKVKGWLADQDLREWASRDRRRLLASKSMFSYRYVTQLDPLECLLFTSLVYQVGPQLESIRIPQREGIVFSWRFKPAADGQMFDPHSRWYHFNERCSLLASRSKTHHVVVADIADFFPRIYSHPLEQALARATNSSPDSYCILRMIKNWNAFAAQFNSAICSRSSWADSTIDRCNKN